MVAVALKKTKGQAGDQPLDLPLESVAKIDFSTKGGRSVELRVRNTETNEGEDGVSTIRDGRTNYFIFPGETGADAKWLMGTDFEATVRLSISGDGIDYKAGPFELKPHVH